MFSKSTQNILFSKIYSTLLYNKESLRPINGYGSEAILNLISTWHRFAKISAEPEEPTHKNVVSITMGYYSIYANYSELYENLTYIFDHINLKSIQASGYIISDRNQEQYSVLQNLITLLPGKYKPTFNEENFTHSEKNLYIS